TVSYVKTSQDTHPTSDQRYGKRKSWVCLGGAVTELAAEARRRATPRSVLRSELLLELLLELRHPLAERLELLLAECLLRLREDFLLFFLGVVLDHVLQYLHAARELVGGRLRALDIGQHELAYRPVLFLRLVEEPFALLRLRITERRVKHLFLDLRVDQHFLLDLLQQLAALLRGAICRARQLRQQIAYLVMILLQHVDRIHRWHLARLLVSTL